MIICTGRRPCLRPSVGTMSWRLDSRVRLAGHPAPWWRSVVGLRRVYLPQNILDVQKIPLRTLASHTHTPTQSLCFVYFHSVFWVPDMLSICCSAVQDSFTIVLNFRFPSGWDSNGEYGAEIRHSTWNHLIFFDIILVYYGLKRWLIDG